MKRTLVLAEPVVFKSATHRLLKYTMYGALAYIIGLSIVGIVRLGLVPASLVGAVAILVCGFLLYGLIDHFEKQIVIDRDGIEVRSPLRCRRIEWDSELSFRTFKNRQGFHHTLTNGKDTVKFGDNFVNYPYMVDLVNAVATLRGNCDHGIKPPAPPKRPVYSDKNIVHFTFFGIIAVAIGAVLSFGSYEGTQITAPALACIGFVYLIMAFVEYKTIKSRGTLG